MIAGKRIGTLVLAAVLAGCSQDAPPPASAPGESSAAARSGDPAASMPQPTIQTLQSYVAARIATPDAAATEWPTNFVLETQSMIVDEGFSCGQLSTITVDAAKTKPTETALRVVCDDGTPAAAAYDVVASPEGRTVRRAAGQGG